MKYLAWVVGFLYFIFLALPVFVIVYTSVHIAFFLIDAYNFFKTWRGKY